MKFLAVVVLAFVQLCVIAQNKTGKKIQIQWVDHLPGDFSFAKKWSYPEGVYKNEFGQFSCDGICPEKIYSMMDSTGKIYEDSLEAFYNIIDTSHNFHSIKANAWCYEYAGTDFISCTELRCVTLLNAATHSFLDLKFGEVDKFNHRNKYCYPSVILLNIDNGNKTIFPCISGSIKVDKKLWDKGIFKATFDFKFKNSIDKSESVYWKGKTYALIETAERWNRE